MLDCDLHFLEIKTALNNFYITGAIVDALLLRGFCLTGGTQQSY
jgi:hypothetical protein